MVELLNFFIEQLKRIISLLAGFEVVSGVSILSLMAVFIILGILIFNLVIKARRGYK